MINSSKFKERIAVIQGKIIEGNQLKSYNQTEPLLKSLISSSKCQFIFTRDRELLSDYLQIHFMPGL